MSIENQESAEVPRARIEAIAMIEGDESAIKALEDADERIARGEDPAFFIIGNRLLVGPRLDGGGHNS